MYSSFKIKVDMRWSENGFIRLQGFTILFLFFKKWKIIYAIHPYKVYSSMSFSVFAELCI